MSFTCSTHVSRRTMAGSRKLAAVGCLAKNPQRTQQGFCSDQLARLALQAVFFLKRGSPCTILQPRQCSSGLFSWSRGSSCPPMPVDLASCTNKRVNPFSRGPALRCAALLCSALVANRHLLHPIPNTEHCFSCLCLHLSLPSARATFLSDFCSLSGAPFLLPASVV